jgi:hypothetical protein
MRLEKLFIIAVKLVAAGMLFWAMGGTPTQHVTHSAGRRHTAHAAGQTRQSSGHGYDYYVLLRWVVCGVGALGAFRAAGFAGW